MPAIRAFIALPASADVKRQIAEIQSELKSAHAEVKWDLPDKFHLTLKFLGNCEPSKIETLGSALAKKIRPCPKITLVYDSLGVFPDLRNPRVVWIGVKAGQALTDLRSTIENVCAECGFLKEDRAFHPHITLGRVKSTQNIVHLTDAIKTITFEPIKLNCSEVLLMKSDLRPGGSIYSILKSFPLIS
jgi:RNA 2',3'-cyclic 3'-phosphodiesterase